MATKDHIQELLPTLPEDRLRELLDFARFLSWQEERAE